ncbi:Antigen C (fragment) [Listeria monocytogenes]
MEYTKILNQIYELYQNVLANCYIKQKNVSVMLDLSNEII